MYKKPQVNTYTKKDTVTAMKNYKGKNTKFTCSAKEAYMTKTAMCNLGSIYTCHRDHVDSENIDN